MSTLEIYPPGSTVHLFDTETKCRVTQVSIIGHEGHHTIRYEIAWLSNGDRKSTWIESFEIKSSPEGKSRVGFILT